MDYQQKSNGPTPLFMKHINLMHTLICFFLQFSLSVKDHLFMPHVRPVKLAGGGKVVKVQNYFNAFIKLSHPLTKFTIPQAISDLYSLLITLLAL